MSVGVQVIGVDPGGTTGIVAFTVAPGHLVAVPIVVQSSPAGVLPIVDMLLDTHAGLSVLAVEDFVVRGRASRSGTASAGATARTLIAELRARERASDRIRAGVHVYLRSASAVKPWATDDRLAAEGLVTLTKGMPHARDACRHALFAACRDLGYPDPLAATRKA